MADQPGHRGGSSPAEPRQQQQQQQHQQHHQNDNKQDRPPAGQQPGFHQNPSRQFYPQHQSSPQQYIANPQQPYRHQAQINAHPGQYDMNAMAQNLPKIDYRQAPYGPGARGFNPAMAPSPGAPGQAAVSASRFAAPGSVPGPMQTFYMPQPSSMAASPYYGSPVPAMHPTSPPPMSPRHGGYGYYPSQAQAPATYYYQQPSPYSHQNQAMQHQAVPGNYSSSAYVQRRKSQPVVVARSAQQEGHDQARAASVVRGPPRKPKQSGHAIWIGNLPPQTDLMSLVHHVCQQTAGLESLFLISKSNCAFANFQDEQGCLAAQQKLNDTWFMSVRLVSRLRKNAVEGAQGVTAPTGPTALAGVPIQQHLAQPVGNQNQIDGGKTDGDAAGAGAEVDGDAEKPKTSSTPRSLIVDGTGKLNPDANYEEGSTTTPVSGSETAGRPDKFFILKSLTVEDLELSVRTGIWATQSHNEEALNTAFKSCDNVYLIFSANKSGEYFGYARMTSEMNEDPAAAIEFAPKAQAFNDADLPKSIPTEATESTPRGRIIDDSARGTIFWEAQRDEGSAEGQVGGQTEGDADGAEDGHTDGVVAVGGEDADATASDLPDDASSVKSAGAETDGADEPKAWGKPFQLQWLSTARLPFYRTRGMRNPLNANREIKIARDGTEVDAAVGRKLVNLFHQTAAGSPVAGGGRAAMPVVTGYPPSLGTRPPY